MNIASIALNIHEIAVVNRVVTLFANVRDVQHRAVIADAKSVVRTGICMIENICKMRNGLD